MERYNKTLGRKEAVPIASYTSYIAKADKTGKLNGWHVEVKYDEAGKPMSAMCTIYRKDFDHPVVWELLASECFALMKGKTIEEGKMPQKSVLETMPVFALKKTCLAQAFRVAFPEEIGILPYLDVEVEGETPRSEEEDEGKKFIKAKEMVLKLVEDTGDHSYDQVIEKAKTIQELRNLYFLIKRKKEQKHELSGADSEQLLPTDQLSG